MEPMQTIKAFIARLAGAPLAPRPSALAAHSPRNASGLYATPGVVDPVARRTARQRDGDDGETWARLHLERAGLRFVAAKVRYRDGEIDLVMRDATRREADGPTLVFVEVRRRARGSHGGAAGSVTHAKRRRIVAAAAHYLVGLGLRTLPPCRFDVVTLEGEHLPTCTVEWLPDAFRDEG